MIQEKINSLVDTMQEKMVVRRRDLHKHPEAAWTEYRTASIVADTLSNLGYEVHTGAEVVKADAMMGVPAASELAAQEKRALAQGANAAWLEKMRGGKTGVVGVLRFDRPGPTVALRFDMDANDVVETDDPAHRPNQEGFASINKGAMHACGHDGHTTIGLAVAEVLASLRGELAGTVKFLFQPAEEGVRGAKAMVAAGVADDVDYLLGMHLGMNLRKTGQVSCNTEGFLATTKIDAEFTGVPAHAGAAPENGHNALLAAACAVLNLHAIARHSQGASRINVGVMHAGTGRNVVPANALLKLETRGTTSAIDGYMYDQAVRILKGAAAMYDVQVALKEMGGAAGCGNTPALVAKLEDIAKDSGVFAEVLPAGNIGGSEDCTYFMERVQQHGGQAAYIMVGTNESAGHHDNRFDFDEHAMPLAAKFLALAAADLLRQK